MGGISLDILFLPWRGRNFTQPHAPNTIAARRFSSRTAAVQTCSVFCQDSGRDSSRGALPVRQFCDRRARKFVEALALVFGVVREDLSAHARFPEAPDMADDALDGERAVLLRMEIVGDVVRHLDERRRAVVALRGHAARSQRNLRWSAAIGTSLMLA